MIHHDYSTHGWTKMSIFHCNPTQVPFAITLPKNQTALLNALNQTLNTLIDDGTVAQLWEKWIPWKRNL